MSLTALLAYLTKNWNIVRQNTTRTVCAFRGRRVMDLKHWNTPTQTMALVAQGTTQSSGGSKLCTDFEPQDCLALLCGDSGGTKPGRLLCALLLRLLSFKFFGTVPHLCQFWQHTVHSTNHVCVRQAQWAARIMCSFNVHHLLAGNKKSMRRLNVSQVRIHVAPMLAVLIQCNGC